MWSYVRNEITRAARRQFFCQRLAVPVRLVSGSLYEPDYINAKPEIPIYDTLNVHLHGYDFAVLESFAKYVHKSADLFDLDASMHPVPARTCTAQSYRAGTSQVEQQYNLALYERVVQVDNLSSVTAPVFIQVLQANMPAGIQMTIKLVDEEEDNFRYVPDLTLMELQTQIAELDKAKEDRKRK